MTSASLASSTVLITGATAGIGFEAARRLAQHGATILVHGRTIEEARAAADALVATTARRRRDPALPDRRGLHPSRRGRSHGPPGHRDAPHLDVLVNNAGIAAPERHTITADGNEIAFQVNFLAHYLLTCLLEPALTSDPGGRVVNVSSSLHRTGNIQWSDPNRTKRYSQLAAYAQSQLALTVFAADPRVTAVSVHPGVCDTALLPLYAHEGVSAAEGAAHVARLCDPAVEIVNGAYYDRDRRVDPAPAATEDRSVKRLNKLAALLVGHDA